MNTPNVLITPRRPAIVAGFDNTLDVLVRFQAPDMPQEGLPERSRLNLALVIDRSGSMSGQPLHEAKRCASFVIDRLKASDRAALIAYDDTVTTLVGSTATADKSPFHRAISRICEGGCTDLHGGWLKGAEETAPHIGPASISRVILLSDGQANKGLTDTDRIFAQCRELAEAGVSTSTYGLGSDFNEDLMIGMARHGQGNSYYGRTAEDLMDPFQEEFALLEALCAKRISARVTVKEGVRLNILNRYQVQPDGRIRLPDLAYSGEVWMLARLSVPLALTSGGDTAELAGLLSVDFSHLDLDGNEHRSAPVGLSLPLLPPAAFQAMSENELVVRRAMELEAADIQDQAREAARRGDWGKVKALLNQVKEQAKDNEWLLGVASTLEELAKREDRESFRKEANYQVSFMRRRMAPKEEMAFVDECRAPKYLRRKVEQGKGQ